jgi:DNA polymerase
MLHLDFETRSELDLKKVGVYKYAEHPSTEVMCMAWAWKDEPVRVWDARHDQFPIDAMNAAMPSYGVHTLHAWNAAFEREIWRTVLPRQLGYAVDITGRFEWRCTMAQALAMGLPGKLERCAPVILGKDGQQKDMAGNRVTMQLSRPRSRDPLVWWEDEDKWQRMMAYCAQDVEVERAIGKHLRPLSAYEQRIWAMDQAINDRGVALDVPLIHAGIALTQEAHRRASLELSELTSGHVTDATQNGRLAQWLGVESVSKDAVAAQLTSDTLTASQRRALTLRQETGMSSLAKLPGMLAAMCGDGRVRGLLQYHAAHTGRWGGRLIQTQNFPRGEVKDAYALIETITRLGAGAYDVLAHVAPPLHVLVAVLRACLVASPGTRFAAWDYAAIEPRVLAWLVGQDDALQRYRDGVDEYKVMASFIYNIPLAAVQKFPHRQLAKAAVLGCGFGMGKKRFKDAAALAPYFLDIDEVMADTAVSTYRARWDKVPQFWRDIERAVVRAIQHHGTVQHATRITCVANAAWLLVKLPSGRLLTYCKPEVEPTLMPWTDRDGQAVWRDTAFAWGENSLTRQWERYSLWGGFLTENIVQAIARDLLADAMYQMWTAYDLLPVLTAHDEAVCEITHDDEAETMRRVMEDVPEWATGLPVMVEGWISTRYQK